jgi:predicted amidohydrolase
MLNNSLKVAAIQMLSVPNCQVNLQTAARLVKEAALNSARMVVLPEFFIQICTPEAQDRFAIAEELGNGVIQTELARLALENNVYLLAGSIPLKSAIIDKYYNAALMYAPDGQLFCAYNKIHLFKFNDGSVAYDEGVDFVAGDKVICCDIDGFKIGLSICYDLRFPELFRAMGVVDVILLPSAFTYQTGLAHWELLARARAVENQCYFVAVNQGGEHESGRKTYGHSLICDPWGELIASCAEGEHIIYAELSSLRLQEVRSKLPALEHRKL